eukprot:gene8793-49938_t
MQDAYRAALDRQLTQRAEDAAAAPAPAAPSRLPPIGGDGGPVADRRAVHHHDAAPRSEGARS